MDSLNCPVCYEKFSENGVHEPHVCPCGHTFCLQCLEFLPSALCPICRHAFPEGTSLDDMPRNLSVVSMLSECRAMSASPSFPSAAAALNNDINISNMSSKQLLELQISVQMRLVEEKRKEFLIQIENNSVEAEKLRRGILQREKQIEMLKQVITEEEWELLESKTRLEEMDKRNITLREQALAEGVTLDIEDKKSDLVDPAAVDPETSIEQNQEENQHNPPSQEIEVNTEELHNLIAVGTTDSMSRLLPPPPPWDRSRIGDRERDRRRPRPGQIVPEPVDEQTIISDVSSGNHTPTHIRSVRRGNSRRGGTVWIESSPGSNNSS